MQKFLFVFLSLFFINAHAIDDMGLIGGNDVDLGNIVVSKSTTQTFTLTNSAANPVYFYEFFFDFVKGQIVFAGNGDFPGGGTCTSDHIDAHGSCTFMVTFKPAAVAAVKANLKINYYNQNVLQHLIMTFHGNGIAVAPTPPGVALLSVSDQPLYDFGTVATGATKEKTFTVTNSGKSLASHIVAAGLAAPFQFLGGSYPGTGGTCTVTLAAGASCQMIVTYAPTATGVQNNSAELDYLNGEVTTSAGFHLSGTAAAPAVLTISNGPTYDFGNLTTGASLDKTFTVNNTGGVAATAIHENGLSAPFILKGGTFPGTSGTCSDTLSPGASCTIVVTFAPANAAAFSSTISLDYGNGVVESASTRPVQGTAHAPPLPALLAISDQPGFNFGTLATGATANHTFTVVNMGQSTASNISESGLAAPFQFLGGTYPGTGGTCSATLAAGASCQMIVSFAPVVTGVPSDSVQLNYFNGTAMTSAIVGVSGTASAPAVLTISDVDPYDFGTVASGTAADHPFTVTNTGGVSATAIQEVGLAMPFNFKGGTFPGAGGTCADILAPGTTCTIVVTFQPTATGLFSDTLVLDYENGVTATSVSRNVQGTMAPAIVPALLTISDGPTYDFATVTLGAAADHAFTVTNSGGSAATQMVGTSLSVPFTFKGGTYPGLGGTCSVTLAPLSTCLIVVTFAPTAIGATNATVATAYFDGLAPANAARALTGTGVLPPPSPAILTLTGTADFGTIALGTSSDQVFTVTNTGKSDATQIGESSLAVPFGFKGGVYPGTGGSCTATIASGAQCMLVLTFAPATAGTFVNMIQLAYFDGKATQTVSQSLTGSGQAPAVNPAVLNISDGPTYDFGLVAQGTSAEHTFTVTNSGGSSATAIVENTLSMPFAFKGGTYPGVGGTCGSTLAMNGTCSLVVVFAPNANALFSGTIGLSYKDGLNTVSSTRSLQGEGAQPALLMISGFNPMNFGNIVVGSGATQTLAFTLTNGGGSLASQISALALSGPFAYVGGTFPGVGGTCGQTLAAGAVCSFTVNFEPRSNGTFVDTIKIDYNDGTTTQEASRDVVGTGAQPALLKFYNGTSYDFGNVQTGVVKIHTFMLGNYGGTAATLVDGKGLALPFRFAGVTVFPGGGGTCGAVLQPGKDCQVRIAFEPKKYGSASGKLTVTYFDGVNSQSFDESLKAFGTKPGKP